MKENDPWTCPYCGSRLIFDYATHAYICPVCGIVFEYEMVPSYVQLQHSSPLDLTSHLKVDNEVIEKATALFGEKVAKELRQYRREKAEEILRALEFVVKRRYYRVSWSAIKKALEIASKCSLDVDMEALREQMLLDEIRKIVERENLPADPEDIFMFALRHKNLWAGRKSSTIALVFTYIYAKEKLGKEIRVKPRLRKLISRMYKVVRERE